MGDVRPGSARRNAHRPLRGGRLLPASAVVTRTPVLELAAPVLAVFALYAGAGATIDAPRAFSDELLYVEAGASLADGDGLHIRVAPYQYGPLFPVAVAAAVAVTGDLEGA